jgi:hypothetical protein
MVEVREKVVLGGKCTSKMSDREGGVDERAVDGRAGFGRGEEAVVEGGEDMSMQEGLVRGFTELAEEPAIPLVRW